MVYGVLITLSAWAVSTTVYNIVYHSEISNKKTQMLVELYKYGDELDFPIVKTGEGKYLSFTKSMYITFSAGDISQDIVVKKVVDVLSKNGYVVKKYSNISDPFIIFESDKYLLSFGVQSKKNKVWYLSIYENTFWGRRGW